jgi:bifunctional UDP-N-acetylglucosamine pyrophosphorylase/glucosamine-1-phosphate N-acetyltransferase/UDP-N-acetylglucosamine pyrophosphorylase
MRTDLPKVLCQANGRPLLAYVLDALHAAGIARILVVVGYRGEWVRAAVAGHAGVECVEQTERLGTGHAVKMCRPQLDLVSGPVVVVAGDSPLIQADSIRELLAAFQATSAACLLGTLHKSDPTGLGRIIRDAAGRFQAIVEERDATDERRLVTEVNMSTYVFAAQKLAFALDRLRNENRQREYYLTDCPAILLAQGERVEALPVLRPCEALSVNTPEELALAEAELRRLAPRHAAFPETP